MRNILWSAVIGMAVGVVPALEAQGSGGPAAAAVCLTCHGPAVEAAATPGAPPFPRLEGLHAEYIAKQLRDFKAGRRANDLMRPILASLGGRQFDELAHYFASQPTSRRAPENARLAEQGRMLFEQGNLASGVPACVGCHLDMAAGAPRYPRLAGQRPAYLRQQLMNFKTGTRKNDRAHVMRSVASKLTDEEMAAVAEFLGGL